MREVREFRAAERTIDSIVVGVRHRTDLGDLDELVASIQRVGLLQPITVTETGVLVCGRRRLEALKILGLKTVKVWVRAEISDKLSQLLAQQDENLLHKPLSPIEATALYRELKELLASDARRRQEDSLFGAAGGNGAANGGGDSPPPRTDATRTRAQAAHMITGDDSSQRFERISKLEAIVDDDGRPLAIRRLAETKVDEIKRGAPVAPAFDTVMHAIRGLDAQVAAKPELTEEEIAELGRQAWLRARTERRRRVQQLASRKPPSTPTRRSPKALVQTFREMDGWTAHYDAVDVAGALSDSDWVMCERVVAQTVAFFDAARAARALGAPALTSAGA